MQRTATKTIEAKIPYQDLTRKKQQALDNEYNAVQAYTHGNNSAELYSATKQQQDRKIDKINPDHDYPWFIRNDTFNIEHHNTNKYSWWANIPVASEYGGINIPLQPYESLENYEFGDSKIVKKNNDYYLQLTAKQEVEVDAEYDTVIGVDLGSRWVAVSVSLPSRETKFYGEEIRQYRRHSHETRKNLQEKRAYQTLSSIKNREHRQVDDRLHKISREIVEDAKEKNAAIVIGDLEGIQDDDKGSEMNRRLHSMPHYKLKQYVEYKALFEGVAVVVVDECMTSQTCWRCGEQSNTSRVGQGLFECHSCGLEDNADKNGALNIVKKGLGKDVNLVLNEESPLSKLGAVCGPALELDGDDHASADGACLSVRVQPNPEANGFSRW